MNVEKTAGRIQKLRIQVLNFVEEHGPEWQDVSKQSPWMQLAQFWLMVTKSFSRNRCPSRAAALAYTTLLALIPMLAVGASVAISLLQSEGQAFIEKMVDQLVGYVAPILDLQVRSAEVNVSSNRELVVAQITNFINNISSGTLGVASMLALVLVAIEMLRTVEATFNDIWGVSRCRNWLKSLVQYWAVISLGPLVVMLAIGITSGPRIEKTEAIIHSFPILSAIFFAAAPFFLLSFAFTLFYVFIPNTRVHFSAALTGGLVAGFLWQVNSQMTVVYASKVVSYSKIYGSLSLVPLFLVSLYLAWLFLLFGAQVAYAYQNRIAYMQEKMAENIHEQGREFLALRIMALVSQRFMQAAKPASTSEISALLGVPSSLSAKILSALVHARLLVETTGGESAFCPGRPLEHICISDVLMAIRTSNGQDIQTREDALKEVVRKLSNQVIEAERTAARSVTMAMIVKNSMVDQTGSPSEQPVPTRSAEKK